MGSREKENRVSDLFTGYAVWFNQGPELSWPQNEDYNGPYSKDIVKIEMPGKHLAFPEGITLFMVMILVSLA